MNQPQILLFVISSLIVIKAPIGLFAGFASAWIKTREGVLSLINRVSGTMLIGLGLKLALEQR